MLKLICGPAAPEMRRLLVESFLESRGSDGTIFIVPDDHFAQARRQCWSAQAGALHTGAIVSLPELSQRIQESAQNNNTQNTLENVNRPDAGEWFGEQEFSLDSQFCARCIIEPAERLAIMRQIILGAPAQFDQLVGEKSAPHLTHGVLQRIADAVARVVDRDNAMDEAGHSETQRESARLRQLRDLSRLYEQRLESAGAIESRTALRQSWTMLTIESLEQLLPGHKRIVLDAFDAIDDVSILAVRRLRDIAKDTLVLLDYDPEVDADRYSHLNSAYERLYDLSDGVVLDPSAFESVLGADSPATATGQAARQIVDVPTRTAEVQLIAQFLRSQLDEASAGDKSRTFAYHDYTICFPALQTYAPLVREMFAEYGLPCTIHQSEPVLNQPIAVLLEALRNALVERLSLVSLRNLLKCRLLAAVLTQHGILASVDTLLQAQLLERLRREEGVNSAGRYLIVDIRRIISKEGDYLSALQFSGVDTEDEHPKCSLLRDKIDAYRLLEHTLSAVLQLLQQMNERRSLSEWRDQLSLLLDQCMAFVTIGVGNGETHGPCICLPPGECARITSAHLIISQSAQRLVDCGGVFDAGSIEYPRFLSMLRVLLRGIKLPPDLPTQQGFTVGGVLPSRGRDPKVVILGGLVDGDFPKYLNREARLEDEPPGRLDQAQNIARQRFQFDALLRNASERVILFVPRADSNSELLESQFVEELELESDGTTVKNPAEQFLASLRARSASAGEALDDFAVAIRDDRPCFDPVSSVAALLSRGLSPDERRILENITHNVTAQDDRHRIDALGNFDGFIYDPVLLTYLQKRIEQHIHSVSQLDVLVQCPFRYFVEHVLEVRELQEKEEGTAPRRMGELVHTILARFYSEWVRSGRGAIDVHARAEAGPILASHAQAELATAGLSPFERDALLFRLFGSEGVAGLQGTTEAIASAPLWGVRDYPGVLPAFLDLEVERAANARDGLLRPSYFELGFGLPKRHQDGSDDFSSPQPVELALDNKEKIRLRGRSDRVDVGDGRFVIVDYKTGASPTIVAQQQGYKVQLPVYLMAIEQVLTHHGSPLQPAGGMFISISPVKARVEGQFFRKQYLAAAGLAGKRGMSEEDFEESMELVRHRITDGLRRIRSGKFHVTMAGEKIACALCGNARICRKDLSRAKRLVPLVCGS
ncbi:MAG: PD-(D/E)XK nuclease family protein [Candidatus Sumerlaeaceae bacterium]